MAGFTLVKANSAKIKSGTGGFDVNTSTLSFPLCMADLGPDCC